MRNHISSINIFLLLLMGALFFSVPASAVEDQEGILVGRVEYMEGDLYRYIEEEKDWVLTVKDAPFGIKDALYSGEGGKAEFILPNMTWLRIGENSQLQLIDITPDATTVDVGSGLARVYNKSADGIIKVTTPFGYVVAEAGSTCDVYVGDESLEVIAVRGTVDFVHKATGTRYSVQEGGESIIADQQGTAQGNGKVDADWDDWNGSRDNVWVQRMQARGPSADLLPEPIREEAYIFEENGRWERVSYEGSYRDMWRPLRIDNNWRPYTAGRWVVYYGDNCWVPDEPFGYVTHHYGSWVYVDSFRSWYWMPPVVHRPSNRSRSISVGWYPGRVGWFYDNDSIGWVPLAPDEIYYGHRLWGRHTRLVDRSVNVNISINQYRYLDEAVLIPRDDFFRGNRYTPYVQRHVDRNSITRSYKPTMVINNTVINNFTADPRRFAVNNSEMTRKPHAVVTDRILTNQKLIRDTGRMDRKHIEKDLGRARHGVKPTSTGDILAPTLRNKMVETSHTAAPFDAASRPSREIKGRNRGRGDTAERQRQDARQNAPIQENGPGKPNAEKAIGNKWIRSPRGDQGQRLDRNSAESRLQEQQRERQTPETREQTEQTIPSSSKNKRTIRSPREERMERGGQSLPDSSPPIGKNRQDQNFRGEVDQQKTADTLEQERQIRSPREKRNQQPVQNPDQLNRRQPRQQDIEEKRQSDEPQGAPKTNPRRQRNEQGDSPAEDQRRQQDVLEGREKEAIQQQRQTEMQQQKMQQRTEKDNQRRQQDEAGRQQVDAQERQAREQQGRQQDALKAQQKEAAQQQRQAEMQQQKMQQRKEQDNQRRQQDEAGRQQRDAQERQAREQQGRQQDALKAQQKDAAQQQRQAEMQQQKMQQRKEEDNQRRQQDEAGRQQRDAQERQAREQQSRQQDALKAQQKDAAQQQRQAEMQQQKMQLRKEEDNQRRQQDEAGRQQKAGQERQAREQQNRQQDALKNQQQENQRRQQREMQQPQPNEGNNQQQPKDQQPQKKGKKKVTPQEEELLQQQQSQ